jgi:hypothetical protein
VTYVEVEHRRDQIVRVQRHHPADAHEDVLLDAVLVIAAVKVTRERAVGRFVRRGIGIEQVHRHAPDDLPPDLRPHGTVGNGDVDRLAGVGDRKMREIEARIRHARRPVGRELLRVVAAAVEQSDGDERNAKVRGRFDVIARKDSQASGILRK